MYASLSRRKTSLICGVTVLLHLCWLCLLFVSYLLHNAVFVPKNKMVNLEILSRGAKTAVPVTFANPHIPHPEPITKPQTQSMQEQTQQQPLSTQLKLPEIDHAPETAGSQKTAPTASDTPVAASEHAPQAPKITMYDLAQGFLKSMQQERGRTPQKQISTEEIMMQSYTTKVWDLLKKSVFVEARAINMMHSISTDVLLLITLNKVGAITNFEFRHSRAGNDLHAVEATLRRAAYTTGLYPTFPRTFKADTCTLSLPLHIEVREGIHRYQLLTQ